MAIPQLKVLLNDHSGLLETFSCEISQVEQQATRLQSGNSIKGY